MFFQFGRTMSDSPADSIDVLARRAELLDALRDGPRSKPDLVSAWSMSRSTVDRAVRTLESRGFVERADCVSLTLQGRLALDAYEELAELVTAIEDATPVLDVLSPATAFDAALLRDANVVRPDPVAPQRPYVAYQELVEDATAVRGFVAAVLEENVPVFRERIVDDDVHVDLTLSPDALDELVSSHADAIEESMATGRLTLRRADETLEYALMLVEQADRTLACALVYGDNGLAGTIHNDDPDAVRWAERVYERLRRQAEPLHE